MALTSKTVISQSFSVLRRFGKIKFQRRSISKSFSYKKVPESPTWVEIDEKKLPDVPPLDKEMIEHLERLSLVMFNNKAGVERLQSAIKFANQLYMVDTEGVEPLDNVLEDRELYLRGDEVTEGKCRPEILQNAVKTEEDYFVAPPANSADPDEMPHHAAFHLGPHYFLQVARMQGLNSNIPLGTRDKTFEDT